MESFDKNCATAVQHSCSSFLLLFVYKQFPLPVSSQLTANCGLESVDWWSSTALGREGTGRDKCLLGLQLVGTRTYNFSLLIYHSFGLFSCKINLANEATIIITPITSFLCQQTSDFVICCILYTTLPLVLLRLAVFTTCVICPPTSVSCSYIAVKLGKYF